jgi:iron(III) transport system permease protein
MPSTDRSLPAQLLKLALPAVLPLGFAALWWIDRRVGRLWLNTAGVICGACAIALPLGTLLAVLIFKTDAPGRRVAAWLLVGMLFVPLYLFTGAWDAGFGIQGWHTLVTNPHLAHQPWLAGWRAAIWVHGLAAVPWVVLIVGSGLRAVEAEIEEDAATCASPLKVLWHVSLRRAAPAIAVAALWVGTVVLTEISVTDFFQVRTFAEEVYTQAALGSFDYGNNLGSLTAANSTGQLRTPAVNPAEFPAFGLWSGLALAAIATLFVITGISRVLTNLADTQHRAPWIWHLKRARWPMALALWASMSLLAGIPLANLSYKAGVQVLATETGRLRTWSAAKAIERVAQAPVDFRGELWLSTWLGIAAATAATTIALPMAWPLRPAVSLSLRERAGVRVSYLLLIVLALLLTIPGPLLGIAVIRILDRPVGSPFAVLAALYDSNFAPWLVQTIRALPITAIVLLPALASIPQATLDAAAADGTGWWGRLFRIALPQRWPAIAAAWLIALAISIGELAATVLVMPPQSGASALSIQVFQLLHYGVDDRVAAICLFMVFMVAAITGIAAALLRRKV